MQAPTLDATATAIASAPRRAILERLAAAGSASVTELADLLGVSVPATLKHVDHLVRGGVITRSKTGRVVTVALVPGSLDELVAWATRTRLFWSNHLDRYAAHLAATTADDDNDDDNDDNDNDKERA